MYIFIHLQRHNDIKNCQCLVNLHYTVRNFLHVMPAVKMFSFWTLSTFSPLDVWIKDIQLYFHKKSKTHSISLVMYHSLVISYIINDFLHQSLCISHWSLVTYPNIFYINGNVSFIGHWLHNQWFFTSLVMKKILQQCLATFRFS